MRAAAPLELEYRENEVGRRQEIAEVGGVADIATSTAKLRPTQRPSMFGGSEVLR